MKPKRSRRDFVATSLAATAASVVPRVSPLLVEPPFTSLQTPGGFAQLIIKPRYHRWHVDPGVDWVETNTGYATLDWTIPVPQAAIVLVDVWDRHYLKDTEARAEAIIADKLLPLLVACRSTAMPIIHAPSPTMAMRHPNWVRLVREDELPAMRADWPPSEFREKAGVYRSYRRPDEPREAEIAHLRAGLTLHPLVQPLADEPVVATGEELHRCCRQREILFLLFAGFNTNACILQRDYGTLAMSRRGYEVILVRDCTTGMESRETQAKLRQTEGAVALLEMFGSYSITSDEIKSGLRAVKTDDMPS
jgi:nicotinamidase-related amidase